MSGNIPYFSFSYRAQLNWCFASSLREVTLIFSFQNRTRDKCPKKFSEATSEYQFLPQNPGLLLFLRGAGNFERNFGLQAENMKFNIRTEE